MTKGTTGEVPDLVTYARGRTRRGRLEELLSPEDRKMVDDGLAVGIGDTLIAEWLTKKGYKVTRAQARSYRERNRVL